ncbi:MAG: DUF5317 domain-containing protein [Chloroflexota bacterium]|nr:DUF5317 domain-containing protein [Chloroflexota bacterium]
MAAIRPRWWLLGLVAVAARFGSSFIGPLEASRLAHALSMWGVAGFALVNVRLPGAAIIAIGMFLNALVVSANGGVMPVSLDAAEIARGCRCLLGPALHIAMTESTPLGILGDVVPFPPTGNVYSPGDLLAWIGGAILVARISGHPVDAKPPRPESIMPRS